MDNNSANINLQHFVKSLETSKGIELTFLDMYRLLVLILQSSDANVNTELFEDLKSAKQEMDLIRDELNKSNPDGLGTSNNSADTFDILPLSIKDLSGVYKVIEDATVSILDESDNIEKLLNSGAKKEDIISSLNKLRESCNFQDLSGQRINRVIKNLQHFENTVFKIFKAILGSNLVKKNANANYKIKDDSLVTGPAIDSNPSQEDIDKLFG
jgi:chemotaxis protein CheZ